METKASGEYIVQARFGSSMDGCGGGRSYDRQDAENPHGCPQWHVYAHEVVGRKGFNPGARIRVTVEVLEEGEPLTECGNPWPGHHTHCKFRDDLVREDAMARFGLKEGDEVVLDTAAYSDDRTYIVDGFSRFGSEFEQCIVNEVKVYRADKPDSFGQYVNPVHLSKVVMV